MALATLLSRGLQMVSLSITGADACCEEGEKCCFLCAPRAFFLRPRIDFGLILLHKAPRENPDQFFERVYIILR